MRVSIYLTVLMMLLASCGKTYQCIKATLVPAYVSYADDEADTIVLRRFAPGSNFSTRIDSAILTASNCLFYKVSDTITVSPFDYNLRISDNYDWQIVNPFDQKTVSISNMKFMINEGKEGGLFRMDPQPCSSPVIAYMRDNQVIDLKGDSLVYVFIHK